MADLKISQLSGASTPLAGTEVLPIVQSGSTKKVSVADLTLGRAVASAGGTFSDNFVQGTAAKGVNFTANTPAAGMTSQLLNWYEEGTWTPTYTGWTIAPTTISAQYTRIGRQVTVTLYATNGENNYAGIGGLPFAANSTQGSAGAINSSSNIPNYYTCSVIPSASTVGGFLVILTGAYWQLTITYFV